MVVEYVCIQFCSIFKCFVNCGEYLISMLLGESLHKGKMLTYFESRLCVRRSAGCFPGSFQGRSCFGPLSLSFLCHCSLNQFQGSNHVFSCFQVDSYQRHCWAGTMPYVFTTPNPLLKLFLWPLCSLVPAVLGSFHILTVLLFLFIHCDSGIFSIIGSKISRLQSVFSPGFSEAKLQENRPQQFLFSHLRCSSAPYSTSSLSSFFLNSYAP